MITCYIYNTFSRQKNSKSKHRGHRQVITLCLNAIAVPHPTQYTQSNKTNIYIYEYLYIHIYIYTETIYKQKNIYIWSNTNGIVLDFVIKLIFLLPWANYPCGAYMHLYPPALVGLGSTTRYHSPQDGPGYFF